MLDWLRLFRASGVATVLSNLLAASAVAFYAADGLNPTWFLARLLHEPQRLLWVPLASMLLYAAGMAWNDLVDLERDRGIHPQRPLPSGRINLAMAYVVTALMSVGALVAAAMVNWGLSAGEVAMGIAAAGIVLSLSLLYNFGAKEIPWLGSLVMAAVRSGHALFALLLIGPDFLRLALAGGSVAGVGSPLAYPLTIGLYVFGLTLVSEGETRAARRWELLVGGLCMAAALAVVLARLASSPWLPPLLRGGGVKVVLGVATLALAGGLVAWAASAVGRPWWDAVRRARRGLVGRSVAASLGGMILLDAALAATAQPLVGLLIVLLYPAFRGASRAVRMD